MAVIETTVVVLRESLEALLVVGILVGLVSKLGHPEARKKVYMGAGLGLVVSVIAGVLLYKFAGDLFADNEPLFEGVASLIAVVLLTYMIVWMYRHTIATVGGLHDKAKEALLSGKAGIVVGMAFIIVLREGIETILFIATGVASSTPASVLIGVVVGAGIATSIAVLVFRRVIKLSIEKFFAVTGVLLVLFGGGMAMHAVHELSEPVDEGGPGWFPETRKLWDWSGVLPHKCETDVDGDGTNDVTIGCAIGGVLNGALGYRPAPRAAELAVYLLYVGGLLAWYLRPVVQRRKMHPSHGRKA